MGVLVGVGDGPGVAVFVGVGEGPGVAVFVGVGDGPGVGVFVGVGVGVGGNVTVTQAENSEVLPLGSVATAVMLSPGDTNPVRSAVLSP